MKQVLQKLNSGQTYVIDVPCPKPTEGQALIKTSYTLVSSGTERMLVEFGKSNYIQKAIQQPDKVKMVMDKFLVDGFFLPLMQFVQS